MRRGGQGWPSLARGWCSTFKPKSARPHLAGDTLEEVIAAAERGVQRIRNTPHLAFSFLRHCGLSLW